MCQQNLMLNKLFYILIGIIASLFLTIVFYYALSLDSSIYTLIQNTKNAPLYLFFYGFFTFGAIVLFGINISFFTYKWINFNFLKLKTQTGNGLGIVTGIFASACPICGSTLLSLIGITSGLAAFPFQGLELKALSFGFMALPLIFSKKEFANLINSKNGNESAHKTLCEDNCPEITTKTQAQIKNIKSWLVFLLLIIIALGNFGLKLLKSDPIFKNLYFSASANTAAFKNTGNLTSEEIKEKVIPEKGYQSKIALNDSVLKMIKYGVLDPQKFEAIYTERGGLPEKFKNILKEPSYEKITLNKENSYIYINLLWPLGISNYMTANLESPLNGDDLFNFASTGGWNLGKEENGGAYFNKFKIVDLTPEQETLAVKVAKNIYRPCCGNSAFFQDCNHGSAILGLLELGAAQGLNENELYREALAFNSFWFPDTYLQIALYFKNAENIDWQNIDPKMVLSKEYSSSYGFKQNVYQKLKDLNILPQNNSNTGCGV